MKRGVHLEESKGCGIGWALDYVGENLDSEEWELPSKKSPDLLVLDIGQVQGSQSVLQG